MGNATTTPLVYSPGEAASRLGLTVPDLVAQIRVHRYPFIALKEDGKPGDRGRNRWGLTEEQIRRILRGMERVLPEPVPAEPARGRPTSDSPDGKSRLRRGRSR